MRGHGENKSVKRDMTRDGKRKILPGEHQRILEQETWVPVNSDYSICHICSKDFPGPPLYKFSIVSYTSLLTKRYICDGCRENVSSASEEELHEFIDKILESRDRSVFLFSAPPDKDEFFYLSKEIKRRA